MMIGSTVEYLAVNNESQLLRGGGGGLTSTEVTGGLINRTCLVNKPSSLSDGLNKSSSHLSISSSDTSGTGTIGTGATSVNGGSGGGQSSMATMSSVVTSTSGVSSTTTGSSLPHRNYVDLRRVYAGLNDIDERLNRPISIEFFLADDYLLDMFQTNTGNQLSAKNTNINTISPKVGCFFFVFFFLNLLGMMKFFN